MKPASSPNIGVPMPGRPLRPSAVAPVGALLRRALIVCGIASSLLYVAMNVFVPTLYPGYDWTSQTVSELSAIDAPTQPLWVVLGAAYTVLLIAFGVGLVASAAHNRPLRIAGVWLILDGLIGFFWPPMHQRGETPTVTDSLHIAFTLMTLVMMMLAMAYGAGAFGRGFRLYTFLTAMVLIAFGVMTGVNAGNIPENLPTPMIGVWERINIASFMLWVVVLAIAVLRSPEALPREGETP